MRILIADDNERVRRGVAAILSSQENWSMCGEATDGAETIQKTVELNPDLILLDVCLPDMDGLQVARRVRENNPKVKILIISSNDANRLLPSVLEAGADGCLDKSRLASDLLETVMRIESSL